MKLEERFTIAHQAHQEAILKFAHILVASEQAAMRMREAIDAMKVEIKKLKTTNGRDV